MGWDTLNYESEAISRFDLAQAAIEAEARITRASAHLGIYPRRDLKRLQHESSRLEDSLLEDFLLAGAE